ncbi:MAG: DUF423 domain-containing protein [Cyclobacteriaceae bacterium]|jgi:uncharacterized membrane protein YgdD (TMEM256/DUF423 family)|nr:DUF423 domain-containing protein [Flammeovirgaceae bacterium]MCZ8022312.1 DUF423 domain-containing protein [Cytophagales bacterium]MCZ8326617.1 DUF423 domain-containing protein [Cyclobacteriaceae bacterium]
MNKKFILIAGALGFLAVAFGAFGAHALKDLLEANGRSQTFELAVRYHFFHAIALLALGFQNQMRARIVGLLWLIGILLFSGSLYVLAIFNATSVALITPIGGLFLLAGWLTLMVLAYKKNKPA